jgi:hypothetical protein
MDAAVGPGKARKRAARGRMNGVAWKYYCLSVYLAKRIKKLPQRGKAGCHTFKITNDISMTM